MHWQPHQWQDQTVRIKFLDGYEPNELQIVQAVHKTDAQITISDKSTAHATVVLDNPAHASLMLSKAFNDKLKLKKLHIQDI